MRPKEPQKFDAKHLHHVIGLQKKFLWEKRKKKKKINFYLWTGSCFLFADFAEIFHRTLMTILCPQIDNRRGLLAFKLAVISFCQREQKMGRINQFNQPGDRFKNERFSTILKHRQKSPTFTENSLLGWIVPLVTTSQLKIGHKNLMYSGALKRRLSS
jgi:hypothetical protein